MSAQLEISLLGGFRVAVAGEAVADAAWQRARPKTLVKLLALADGHRLHREVAVDQLWPELTPEAAGANLRKAVYFARRALRPDLVLSRAEVLWLPPDRTWVDVDAFDAAADHGDVAAALALYAGDLLPEDLYEEWAVAHRDRLRARLARVLWEQARMLTERNDHRAAAQVLERLALIDPLDEQAVAALMLALARTGQRHLALGWYRELRSRLADEVGVLPGESVRLLNAAIAAGSDDIGQATARPTAAAPGETGTPAPEQRLVTVLLARPSAHSGERDAPGRQARLARWLRDVTGVLETWGAVAEPVADGVLAVFGLPEVHEDDALRAVRAALRLTGELSAQVRVGIATGEVLAPLGQATRARRVAGAVVDEVRRVADLGEPGGVVADERTRRNAGPGIRARPLAHAWGIVAVESCSDVADLGGATVGRRAELAVIEQLVDDVTRRRTPRLLIVVGAAGIGKSRLIREAVSAAQHYRPGVRILSARCSPSGQDAADAPLSQLLHQAYGVSKAVAPEGNWSRLQAGLHSGLGGQMRDADLHATAHALSLAAALPVAGDPLVGLPPQQAREELAHAWSLFFTACAGSGPVLVVLEDLHWASSALLDVVEVAMRRASGPILLAVTSRTDLGSIRPGFDADLDGATSMSLPPLDDADSRALLDRLVADQESRDVDRLLARAEGNPLFIEQLAAHSLGSDDASLPDGLMALLAARLDKVSTPAKRVLQWAATVGRVFWAEPIQRGLRGRPIAEQLLELERRGLVVARSVSTLAGADEYAFRHALIQEAAYASVPAATKARAHAAIGEWLSREPVDEVSELLAHHFSAAVTGSSSDLVAWPDPSERARVRSEAVRHLVASGTVARRRFDLDRAVELHTRAAALSVEATESVSSLEALGEDHEVQYHGDDASTHYRAALEIARREPALASARARLCCRLGLLMAMTPGAFRGSPKASVAEAYVAEGLSAAQNEIQQAWLLLAGAACARLWRGSEPFGQGTELDPVPIEARVADAERSLDVGRRLGVGALVSRANEVLYVLYGIAGAYRDVVAVADQQLADIGTARSRLEQADILRTCAVTAIWVTGDFTEGLDLARRAYALSVHTNPHQLMHATWPLLAALYELGRWEEMTDLLQEHLTALREDPALGCDYVRDGPLIGATMLVHRGRSHEAARMAGHAGDPLADVDTATAWNARYAVAAGQPRLAITISSTKAEHGRMYGPQHAMVLIDALADLGDRARLDAALPAARGWIGGNALLRPYCDRAEGAMLHARGDTDGSAAALRAAVQGFERLRVPFEAARTRLRLAPLQPTGQRRRQRDRALAALERLGVPPPY